MKGTIWETFDDVTRGGDDVLIERNTTLLILGYGKGYNRDAENRWVLVLLPDQSVLKISTWLLPKVARRVA